MTATLNAQIRYENGYITPVETLADECVVDDAEVVESDCRGWGESNAVVRHEGGYYLATVETVYQIETLEHVGRGSTWTPLPSDNEFGTREEAEAAIEQLRTLGDDWAAGEYRVTEVG